MNESLPRGATAASVSLDASRDTDFGITIGAGRKKPQGKRQTFTDWTPANVARAVSDLRGRDAWWSLNRWQAGKALDSRTGKLVDRPDDYKHGDLWTASTGAVLDLDTVGKAMLPDDVHQLVEEAAREGMLPANLMHATPHGIRLARLYDRPVHDPELHFRLWDEFEADVQAALARLGVSLESDAGRDLGRMVFAPNAEVDGEVREAEVIVIHPDLALVAHESGVTESRSLGVTESRQSPVGVAQNKTALPTGDEHDRAVREALEATLPVAAGTRHKRLFEYARRLIAIFGPVEVALLQPHVRTWHSEALEAGTIRTSAFGVTWANFVTAFRRVRTPWGAAGETFKAAAAEAREHPNPIAVQAADALGLDSPVQQALAALCFVLDRLHSGKPFRLPCRWAAEGVGIKHSKTAHRDLEAFCTLGLLKLTERGVKRDPTNPKHKAVSNVYQWQGPRA